MSKVVGAVEAGLRRIFNNERPTSQHSSSLEWPCVASRCDARHDHTKLQLRLSLEVKATEPHSLHCELLSELLWQMRARPFQHTVAAFVLVAL